MKKTIVIVGGSTGIGWAVAKLQQQVYNVIVLDNQPLTDTSLGFDYYHCDVRHYDAIAAACEKIIDRYQSITHLFANAGVHLSATLEETSLEQIDHVLDINLKGTLYVLKALLPHMRQQQFGRIVLGASEQVIVGKPNSTVYGATKAAIAHIAKSVTLDYAQYNIHINAICPGTVDTPLYQKAIKSFCQKTGQNAAQVHQAEAAQQPIGRIGTPDEIAELVAFLLSDKADYMMGANIVIDGGYTVQ